jgi:hypothetical protein
VRCFWLLAKISVIEKPLGNKNKNNNKKEIDETRIIEKRILKLLLV